MVGLKITIRMCKVQCLWGKGVEGAVANPNEITSQGGNKIIQERLRVQKNYKWSDRVAVSVKF